MKKILLIWTFFILPVYFFSLNKDIFSISLTPEAGFVNGRISEYVFEEKCKNTDNVLSRLDWDIFNIPYIELNANMDILKYLNITITGKSCAPIYCGFMQDFDWIHDSPYEDPTELTNYSKSDNFLKSMHAFRATLGANIFCKDFVKISPFVAYDYNFIHFESRNGFYSYKQNDWEIYKMTGKIISYKQEYNSFVLGINSLFNISEKCDIQAMFSMSPFLSFNTALDYHWKRNLIFGDKLYYLMYIKGKISSSYIVNKHSKFGGSFNIWYIPVSKGKNFQATMNSLGIPVTSFYITTAEGGTSGLIWSLALTYTYTF